MTVSTTEPAEALRHVMRQFVKSVTVIASNEHGTDYGMTATAVCTLSLAPASLVACLSVQTRTYRAIRSSGTFTVNLLAAEQRELAEHFALAHELMKFEALSCTRSADGDPLVPGAVAHLECRVVDEALSGTHAAIIAQVTAGAIAPSAPLVLHDGRYGGFRP